MHPRFRTPYLSSLLVGIVVALVAGLTPIDVVAELTNIGTLAAFVLVSAAVLIVSLPWVTLVRFVIWLAIGLVIYFLYSRRKSHLQRGVEAAEEERISV